MSVALAAVLVAGAFAAVSNFEAEPASAADPGLFDPGYIIADHIFYDATSMTPAQIQSFLDSRVPTCRATTGPTCLRYYSQDTVTRAAEAGRCLGYTGRAGETAASIIWNVSQACGISPKVLLVLLEKEQGLISSTAPTTYKYRSATGYGCPDTAACDARYYGFYNQVYMAALQFKRYAANPTGWSYRAGQVNNILFHPNAACGTKPVMIRNQATASLYIYTPYTPNAAAMANINGSGDACSSYGNRNFWRTFSDWFGSTTGDGSPYGEVSTVVAGYGQISVSGWTVDPDLTDPIRAHVYVDGVGAADLAANIVTPSLEWRLGAGNTDRGFATTLQGIQPGAHTVCVFGINTGAGGNTLIECRVVTVLSGSPFGVIDQTAAYTGKVFARGWALDPDTDASVTVRLTIDGSVADEKVADVTKTSLAAAFPGFGTNHAYSFEKSGVSAGAHRVCVEAVNVAGGANATIGCQVVTVLAGSPILHFDEAAAKAPGQVTLRGWAIDPDVVDPLRVHIYVDGQINSKITADVAKPSLATAYFGYGENHAFSTTLTGLTAGTHEVCVIAIGVGSGANTTHCSTLTSPTGSPIVHLDQLQGTSIGTITVRGWAIDPDVVSPVRVHVYVDGALSTKVSADIDKASIGTAFPGYGSTHAFSLALTGIGPGGHNVCVYAINEGGGATSPLCSTVPAVSGSPTLYLDEVTASPGSVLIRGWTIDPDDIAALRVHVYVDDVLATKVTADLVKASLATAFAPFGANHAFSATVTDLAAGTHDVCVISINVGSGGPVSECRAIVVG
jgi:hypothetical protein